MKSSFFLSGLLFFVGLLSSGLTGCRDSPVDAGPCRSEVLMGGIEDNFAPGNAEPASPSSELMDYMLANYYNPYLLHQFDQFEIDRPVGHTFVLPGVDPEHPATVTKGILTIRVKALDGTLHTDWFHVIIDDGKGGIIGGYSSSLANHNGGWLRSGDELLIRLDLGNLPPGENPPQDQTNLLDDMSTGRLHVYLQDDSAVDFMKLEVEYCSECPDGSCTDA